MKNIEPQLIVLVTQVTMMQEYLNVKKTEKKKRDIFRKK